MIKVFEDKNVQTDVHQQTFTLPAPTSTDRGVQTNISADDFINGRCCCACHMTEMLVRSKAEIDANSSMSVTDCPESGTKLSETPSHTSDDIDDVKPGQMSVDTVHDNHTRKTERNDAADVTLTESSSPAKENEAVLLRTSESKMQCGLRSPSEPAGSSDDDNNNSDDSTGRLLTEIDSVRSKANWRYVDVPIPNTAANSRKESVGRGRRPSMDVLQLLSDSNLKNLYQSEKLQSESDPVYNKTIVKITDGILKENFERFINVHGDLHLQIGDYNTMIKGQIEAQNSARVADTEVAPRVGGQTNNRLQRNKGLVDAIRNDDLFTMSELLKTQDGLDIIDGLTLLHLVALYDQYKLVAPLYAFCDYGELYIMKVGPQAQQFCGMTAVQIAHGLQHKATANMITIHNRFAKGLCQLHVAARIGDLRSIDAFCSKIRKVDVPGAYQNTPLYAACVGGKLEAVKKLIEYGADVQKRNDWGDTLLHRAARWGQNDVVKFLLGTTLKNCIDQKNNNGWTALHMAVFYGSVSTVKLLLNNKAEPNTIDVRNRNPLDTAKEYNHKEIVQVLREVGVVPTPPQQETERT